MGAPVLYHYWTSVPNPKSVTKFGGVSTTLAALLLLGIAPTIPRRRPCQRRRSTPDFGNRLRVRDTRVRSLYADRGMAYGPRMSDDLAWLYASAPAAAVRRG